MIIIGSIILFVIIVSSLKLPRLRLGPSALLAALLFGIFVGVSSENYQAGIGAFLVTAVLFW
jgi:uncharacterized membrane protein YczE